MCGYSGGVGGGDGGSGDGGNGDGGGGGSVGGGIKHFSTFYIIVNR